MGHMANRSFLLLLLAGLITTPTLVCTISPSQSPPLHLRPPTTTTATPPEAWTPPPLNGETPSTQPFPSRLPSFRRPPPPPTTPNEPSPPSPPPPQPRTGKTSPNTVAVVVAAMLSVGAVAVAAIVVVRQRTPSAENLGQMVDLAYMETELPEITSPEIVKYLNWAISSELATHADGVGVLNQATSSEIVELEPEAATPTNGVGERDAGGTVPASVIMVA